MKNPSQASELLAALKKYGKHMPVCQAGTKLVDSEGKHKVAPCICGLDAAIQKGEL